VALVGDAVRVAGLPGSDADYVVFVVVVVVIVVLVSGWCGLVVVGPGSGAGGKAGVGEDEGCEVVHALDVSTVVVFVSIRAVGVAGLGFELIVQLTAGVEGVEQVGELDFGLVPRVTGVVEVNFLVQLSPLS
jgi:hypothetical protein